MFALARVLLVAGPVCAIGCDELKGKKEAPPPPPPPVVEVITTELSDVPIYSEWVATLDGTVNASIRAQVSGYLVSQNYTEGSAVRKGDVLFEIDARPFQAVLDQAKGEQGKAEAMLGKAIIDVDRYTPLAREQAISQQELDNAIQAKAAAEAMVSAAKASVEQAQLNLDFTRIVSPIDGIAGLANAQIGDLVGPSTGELTAVSTVDPIRAYILVSEQDYLNKIKEAGSESAETAAERRSNFELILSNGEVYPHRGRFLFVDRQVNVRTGTFKVAVEFANPQSLLRPGQFGRIRAVSQHLEGVICIPQRAVTEMQGAMQIAVVGKDDTVEIRTVTTGPRVGSNWVILDGLQPGESVVAEGTQKVRAGVKVIPRTYVPGTTPDKAAPTGATHAG